MPTKAANLTDGDLLHIMDDEHRAELMPVIIFFGLEVGFGIVGNTLTLYVFFFRYKACNFRYFVLCLALVDFLSCLTTIPGSMISQIFWFDYPVPRICKAKVYFNQFTACSEAALLTAIAVDRYRKVCKPLQWQITHRQTLYACVGIFFVSSLLAITTPIFWGVRTRTKQFRDRNITTIICEKDPKYLGTPYALATTSLTGCLVFVSLIVMFVLYILIVKQFVSKHRDLLRRKGAKTNKVTIGILHDCVRREQSSDNDTDSVEDEQSSVKPADITKSTETRKKVENVMLRKGRRKTLIGLYLSVIFIVTTIIFWSMISIVATGVLDAMSNSQKAAYTFFLRLYFINHVINPVLYGMMDKCFKAEMRRLKNVLNRKCMWFQHEKEVQR